MDRNQMVLETSNVENNSIKSTIARSARLSVAPMMDWTDRHCRMLHRTLSADALLYTEMVTAAAVVHGDRARLLDFDAAEHPVALQLGGADAELLAQAATIGADWGYDEINLNCGCPSDRVQSGAFGAVLMESPDVVARACAAMIAATSVPITVKCRIGVDDQEPRDVLPDFIDQVAASGVTRFTIHARKAWLQGLSPKQNRSIPPLDYDLVKQIKADRPDLHISINGGVETLDQAVELLDAGLDGVMVGRAAYHTPFAILGDADARVFGGDAGISEQDAVTAMLPYIDAHLSAGGRLHQITRHMLGMFNGRPGARMWRRVLSEDGPRDGADTGVVLRAMAHVTEFEG